MAKNGLFFLEPLTNVIETVLFTAAVADEIPMSAILVGPSGVAKSKMLKAYDGDYLHITDSVTSQGLWQIAQNDSKNEKLFIFIPDINPTLSRRSSTTNATIGNLLSITADGTVRVDDGRGEKICKHNPMGMITACTPEIYEKHAKQWFALGLRRRIIPIFYTYSSETTEQLQELVKADKIHAGFSAPNVVVLPPKKNKPFVSENIGMELKHHSEKLAANLGKLSFTENQIKRWYVKNVVPVSPHVAVRTLAMAHALRRNSAKVEQVDVQFVVSFIGFTDAEHPRQI